MADPYSNLSDTPTASSRAPYAVTPHDTNQLPTVPKGLYVGGAGDITLRGVTGAADVMFKNVPAGAELDVEPLYIRATGTSATFIVALA